MRSAVQLYIQPSLKYETRKILTAEVEPCANMTTRAVEQKVTIKESDPQAVTRDLFAIFVISYSS